MYIKSTYDGLHVITGTTEGVSGHFQYFSTIFHLSMTCLDNLLYM